MKANKFCELGLNTVANYKYWSESDCLIANYLLNNL